jgi:hypothetical protein
MQSVKTIKTLVTKNGMDDVLNSLESLLRDEAAVLVKSEEGEENALGQRYYRIIRSLASGRIGEKRCGVCGRDVSVCQGHRLCKLCNAPEGKPHGVVRDSKTGKNVPCPKSSK